MSIMITRRRGLAAGTALAFGAALRPFSALAAEMKVAMLHPGSINDQGWNAAGHAGLKRIEALGFSIAFSENVQAADHVAAMRDYARKGFNIVIGHSGRFLPAAERAAAEFPAVQFVVGSGAKGNGANLRSVEVNRAQFGYVLGILSAHMSKSGMVGAVSGLEGLPTIVAHIGGYRLGVLSVKPSAKVKVIYIKNTEDAAAAKEATLSLIADGADVVSGILGAGQVGIIQAAKEKNVYSTGRSFKHTALAPESVITNILEDWPSIYEAVGRDMKGGRLNGDVSLYGFDTKPVAGASFGHDEKSAFHARMPKEAIAAADAAMTKLAAKTLVLNPTKDDARGGI